MATRSCSSGRPERARLICRQLGRGAIRQNCSVQFVTAATPVAILAEAHADGSLDKQLTTLLWRKLLVIDELVILPFEAKPLACSSNLGLGATRRAQS